MSNDNKTLSTTNGNSVISGIAKQTAKDGIEIKTLQDVEDFAKYLAETSNLVNVFREKDKDGNTVVNIADIVICIMCGADMGLSPVESLMFGKQLNREAVIKYRRGKAMGLDVINSLQNIYIWSSGGREIIYTGINVVLKCLIDAGVDIEVLEDGNKIHYYYHIFTSGNLGEEVEFDERDEFLNNKYTVVNDGKSSAKLKADMDNGKIPIKRFSTKRAVVQLTRGNSKIAIPYTQRDAIEAGYYPGKTSLGEIVEGKDNWIKHLPAMLRKMSIMIGGRIIAGDKLNGIYETDEIGGVKIMTDAEFAAKRGVVIEDINGEDVTHE